MAERGFLIHKSYTSTEVYRLNFLFGKIDEILKKAEKNGKRISTIGMINLDLTWKAVGEMIKNEDLRERFYFDIERVKKKCLRPI